MKNIVTIFTICCLYLSGTAQESNLKKWLKPDHYKVHFAGEIGLLSLGAGKEFFKKDQLEITAFIGFLPKNIGGDDITTISLKTAYWPVKIPLRNNSFFIEPIGIGINLYHAFGENLNKFRDPDLYPPEYYWWTIKYRIAPYLSGRISQKLDRPSLSILQYYYEFGTNDLYLYSWYNNRDKIKPYDIINFSFGISLKFK